jgi:hypothetical protein
MNLLAEALSFKKHSDVINRLEHSRTGAVLSRTAAPAVLVTAEDPEMTATFMISGLLQGCGIRHAGNRKQ